MENFINEHVNLFIGVFAAICVIIVTLLIIASAVSRKKKKALLASDPNLVELIFDTIVATPSPMPLSYSAYVLHSVNGQPAKPMGRHSIIVPSGETELDVEYFMLKSGRNIATSFGRSRCTFVTTPGKKYRMSYNLIDYCLEHKEK